MAANVCTNLARRYVNYGLTSRLCHRCYTHGRQLTNSEVRRKRTTLFEAEKQRQLALVTRTEKIEVRHVGPPEECTLIMNKGLSTPFNCAMHIQELLMTRSALALVNGQPWDMHRPLEEDCELRFLHFLDEDPRLVNTAFWRSCSFILGHILETAFKDKFYVELCSFPKPDILSGSFVCDADLKIPHWKPSAVELNILGGQGVKLYHDDFKFERLDVDASLASQMFEDNRFKSQQVPLIAAESESGSRITLYRMGTHIDMSCGPLISSTNHIGRFSVSAVHSIESSDFGSLSRVQGVALPTSVKMHYWSYEILQKRAAKLNPAPIPSVQTSVSGMAMLEQQ
ncbi:39S ribosomal protein L39, mitochondrial-like [Gigantopelta aegis]|uniref:39S ribosomal protein L39, mitochondrial-like n=1 Tax=Gigantopelta aegis TaxID=1735272 RepID=UPI001B88743A|nr:39S ribosomal protein L39, mitochondrial-like [Gigantopelta aegis]